MVSQEQERIVKFILDTAFAVHSYLGPGLVESAYQTRLLGELNLRSFKDSIRRTVLSDKITSSTFLTSSTSRLKNPVGQV
ncbi:MAG: GxxExxY protein [Treponema sp.]|jgi:hypothetical protein|nr:GxxExxY protein [Treponema sp.]